jgi:outer membrane cobalamin receptor
VFAPPAFLLILGIASSLFSAQGDGFILPSDTNSIAYPATDSPTIAPRPAPRAAAGPDSANTIVVTARRTAKFVPSQRVIEAKDFSGKYQDLQGVLETVSGVTVRNTGGFGHYSDASIRGSSPNQVQFYLDGIPLNGAAGGAVDVSKIPLSSLQTIAVSKGVPALEFFGDNAGGVINLTTTPMKDVSTVTMEIGSLGYRAGSALICKTTGPMTHRLSVNYGWADNNYPYTDSLVTHGSTIAGDDSQKVMDNNFFSTVSAQYANTFVFNDSAKLTSQVSAQVTNEGVFYLPTAGSNDGSIRTGRLSFVESYAAPMGQGRSIVLTAKGKTEDGLFTRFHPFYLSPGQISRDISQPFVSLESVTKDTIGARFTFTGLLSASYNGFKFDNLLWPAGLLLPHYSRLTGKAGLEAGIVFCSQLSGRVGGLYRYEIDSTNDSMTTYGYPLPGGRSTHEGFPCGFSELSYKPFDWLEALASARHSSRSPGFTEKFSQGADFSGNPALRPETRTEYDVGFSFSRSIVSMSSSVFTSVTKDKIIYTMVSHIFVPRNVSDVNGWGVENDVSLVPWSWLSVVNSLTYMENIVYSGTYPSWNGKDEPLLPRWMDNLNVKFRYKNMYATHSAYVTSRYFTGFDNLLNQKVAPQPQLGAGIGCTQGGHIDISFRLENYLDVRNYDFQRPVPGMTWYFVLKYTL